MKKMNAFALMFGTMMDKSIEDYILSPADKEFLQSHSEEEIKQEYELVKAKKSDLSKRERDLVEWFVERIKEVKSD